MDQQLGHGSTPASTNNASTQTEQSEEANEHNLQMFNAQLHLTVQDVLSAFSHALQGSEGSSRYPARARRRRRALRLSTGALLNNSIPQATGNEDDEIWQIEAIFQRPIRDPEGTICRRWRQLQDIEVEGLQSWTLKRTTSNGRPASETPAVFVMKMRAIPMNGGNRRYIGLSRATKEC